MTKGVKNMPRYREIAQGANSRYLSALVVVAPRDESRQEMSRLGSRIHQDQRSHRALNPANEDDVQLLAAVMRGEHLLQGFRNRDIQDQLFEPASSHRVRVRQSQKVGRLPVLLRAHELIAKVPRSRRWRVTRKGQAIITTILVHHYKVWPQTHSTQAT